MKQLVVVLLAVLLSSISANAQQFPDSSSADSTAAADSQEPSVADLEGELGDALEELAETLSVIAGRLANDPELRVSALRAASSLVTVAQVVVEENSEVVEETLRRAAEAISEISVEEVAGQEIAP